MLGTLVVLLLVLLASPLNRYFGSRSALSGAASQLQHDRRQLKQVTSQLALWADPNFVQQQARTRLQYAMPGDTVYIVVGASGQRAAVQVPGPSTAPKRASSWNTTLWDSVSRADAG